MAESPHQSQRVGPRLGAALQLLAALGVSVLLLASIELVCGILLRARPLDTEPGPPRNVGGDAVTTSLRFMEKEPAPLRRDLDLLWRNEPSVERTVLLNPQVPGRTLTWTVRNNSNGYRGGELARDRGADVYRILCVGDSTTFGFNVDQEAPFARELERLLRERYPTRRFEVIDTGVPGWSWVQGLRFVELEGLALHPDLVIAAHGTNDQFWPAKITDREHMWLFENPLLRAVQRASDLAWRTNAYRLLMSLMEVPGEKIPDSPGCEAQIRETGACHRVSLREIEAAVTRLHQLTAAEKIDLLIANLDFLRTPSVGAVKKAVDRWGLRFVDSVEHIAKLRLIDQWRRSQELGLALAKLPLVPAEWGGAPPPPRGPRILLRVAKTAPGSTVTVAGGGRFDERFSFDEPMYDDGTHGDEIAGDGVFSVTIEMPSSVPGLHYRFFQDGVPEFAPVPPFPAGSGDRPAVFNRDGIGPVDTFAERYLMAENAHPNAEGHRVIAADLLQEIERFQSFQSFVRRE